MLPGAKLLLKFKRRFQQFRDKLLFTYRFLNPSRGMLLAHTALLWVLGAFALYLDPNNRPVFIAASIYGTAFGAWSLWSDFFRPPKLDQIEDVEFVRGLNSYLPSSPEELDGFQVIASPDGPIVRSDRFDANALMNPEWDLPLVVSEEPRRHLRQLLRFYGAPIESILKCKGRGSFFINEGKVGIASPLRSEVQSLIVYKTDYYSSALTGDLVTSCFESEIDGRVLTVFHGKQLYPSVQDDGVNRLMEFDQWGLSIHFGVDVLAVTKDFYLQLWVQNRNAMHSMNRLAPTGSGSVDWNDFSDLPESRRTLKNLIEAGGLRELREESSARKTDWHVQRVQAIGYFRMPHRAGKPQFSMLAKLGVSRSALSANPEEVHQAQDDQLYVPKLGSLAAKVDELLTRPRRVLSVPLRGALLGLANAIRQKPELIKATLGYSD